MTQIFISHSHDDSACAEQMRSDLEARGYSTWKDRPHLTPDSPAYLSAFENGIRGSAATVVIWSASAAQCEWVERATLSSQRLQKPILPVVTDGTDLPPTLVNVQRIVSQPPCADAVVQLLPHLPPPESDDALTVLAEQLAHAYIRVRKAGVRRAAKLLEKEAYREKVLALLEDVARKDAMMGVRAMAQALLDADAQKGAPPPLREDASRHIFGVRCPNGHVTYFDRRRVCPDSGTFVRHVVRRAGAELDEIYLRCAECEHEMSVPVDCEGYK